MKYKTFRLRISVASVTVACLMVGLLSPLSVLALAEPTPDQHWPAVDDGGITDGNVRAVVAASDGSFYVAGDFNNVARSYGNAVLASASTGLSEAPFPDVDGDVYITISDGDDGWYIGGIFNRVGTLQRTGVAHILPDGTPDEDFDADVVFATANIIYALATDGTTLFVGGDLDTFPSDETTFSGVAAHGMVALDAATGAPVVGYTQPDMQKLPGIPNASVVYALAVDGGGSVYAGGDFTRIGSGTTRNRMVGFDAATGATTSFDPNVSSVVYAMAVDPSSGDVYAGGSFTTVNGATTRQALASFDSTTGVATSFDPDMDDAVYALAINAADPTTLYAGGAFTTVGMATTRNRLAAFDTGTSATTSFNPDIDDDVYSIALTTAGDTLYAVGPFEDVNVASGSVPRDGIAAFRITNGDDIAGFNQFTQREPYWISVNDNDTSVLIGTYDDAPPFLEDQYKADRGTSYAGPAILHVLADGTVDPDFLAFVDGMVRALALSPDETTLYAGGEFTLVNGVTTRNYLAAFDTSDGDYTGFNPDLDDYVYALAISSDGNTLYAGGDFLEVNVLADSEFRNRLAAFDVGLGADPTDNATAFDPDMNSGVRALALTADDNTLYAGGIFTAANGGTTRNHIAAFTTADGILTVFDPGTNNNVLALALSSDEATVYAGGDFDEVNDPAIARYYAAAFDATTGTATDFDPDANDAVQALAIGPDGIVYLGGAFDRLLDSTTSEEHEYIAAVDPETGVPDAGFDSQLSGISDQVFALAHGGTDNGLLAGGVFNNSFNDPGGDEVPYVVVVGLAHYDDDSVAPTPTPTPSSSSGGGGYYMQQPWQPSPTPIPPGGGDPANLGRYGLTEGDTVSSGGDDPDVYIVNEWGYKRLFLNPIIFSFYGHLGFEKVKGIVPTGRDTFPISGLFRNCEANDPKVYAVEVTGEDTGLLHHVNISGDAAVAQDPHFFHKVFCINTNEFNWYPKSPTPYTSLSQVPVYSRPIRVLGY